MPKISVDNYDTVASWNGSQDLLIVEQTDGTKVATPAQVKQYVLGDMDDVPTEDSDNPVKSGGIFSTMAVPKYDSANRAEYYEGGGAFGGNIDSSPTAGSNNAVSSGGTYTAINNKISVYQPSNESITVTGPYTDIAFTKPVESGYTFYLMAVVAINLAGWNCSNLNPVAGSVRIFTSNTSAVTSQVKTTWLKIKNS